VPVRFFYVDESHDTSKFCLSAIGIRHSVWKECLDEVRKHREMLKHDYGIFLRKEIHAHKFLAGRGRISDRVVTKWERARIFNGLLKLIASLPEIMLFNVCLNKSEHTDPHMIAWDRLTNRIERTMLEMERVEIPKRRELMGCIGPATADAVRCDIEARLLKYKSRAVLISDEGREYEIERAVRKMRAFNPIPSRYGSWPGGRKTKSITADRIIEDPVFRKSHRSYLVQLADCVAYALLKREVQPTSRIRRYGIHQMFDAHLTGICFKQAARDDPQGIVRR